MTAVYVPTSERCILYLNCSLWPVT